jgi:tRNA (adenine22-N1)-methyltransferase
MKLSNRLSAITEYVAPEDKIIDIGCDHALLDVYIANELGKRLIASDIHEGAVNNAAKNIEKYEALNMIDLRLGNGLNVVNPEEINTIIIAGMGFYTIKDILSNSEKMTNVNKIIVQSNTDIVKLRKFVISLGFMINREQLVKDGDIIYTVIEFLKGEEKYSYEEIYFGPKILENKDELFKEYYTKKLLKYENLLLQLPNYELRSMLHHKKLIRIIKKELDIE